MSSKPEIVRKALLELGVDIVDGLPQTAKSAAAADLYTNVYEDMLSCFDWRFAEVFVQLAAEVEKPAIDFWEFKFILPSDYITARRVFPNQRYKIFRNELYAFQNDIKLVYTGRVTEEFMPAYLIQYMIYKLAADIAMPVTQKPELAQYWEEKAERQLAKSKVLDSASQTSPEYQDLGLIRAHNAEFIGSGGPPCL